MNRKLYWQVAPGAIRRRRLWRRAELIVNGAPPAKFFTVSVPGLEIVTTEAGS